MLFAALAASLVLASTPLKVDRGNYVITADAMGRGVPIVAIPGGPGFAGRAVWSFGYEMQDVATVYLFNQLGTGTSQLKPTKNDLKANLSLDRTIEDLDALRKKAGLKKWSVFGQSWGVVVAMTYVSKYPNSVDRLILASIPGFGADLHILSDTLKRIIPKSEQDRIVEAMSKPELTDAQRVAMQVFEGIPYYFADVESGKSKAAKAPKDIFNPEVFLALYPEYSRFMMKQSRTEAIRKWTGSTLILHGHFDPTGAAMGYRLKETFLPKAKIQMMYDVGHFSFIEQPDAFFYHVRTWLKLPLSPAQVEMVNGDALALDKQIAAAKARDAAGWPFGPDPKP